MAGMSIAGRVARLLDCDVTGGRRLSGGDLSEVHQIERADGHRLIAKSAPTAAAEATMLRAIAATGAPVPAVVAVGTDLIVMEEIVASGPLGGAAWSNLADVLDQLHAAGDHAYGWDADHSFGPVAIVNERSADWPRFWADHRLRCHLPHVDPALGRRVGRLADALPDHLPGRPAASLLHGDLWGGNVLVSGDRIAALIDPACYYGDREVDIAMLTLFDSPPADFLDDLALELGWRARLPVYRLWPLLVHLRLFGSGYAPQVDEALSALDY
jgi:fructosamine-3-kinase